MKINQQIVGRPDNSGQAAKWTNDLSKFKLNRFCVQLKDFWIENIRVVFLSKIKEGRLLFWKEKQHVYFQCKSGESLFWFPATSALVERLFSKIGYILRPHHRCMQDDMEENLFYAKENINFLIDKKIF